MTTIKQKKAFDKMVENGGNISKAMREVGYSKMTAKNPSKLTDSKGWEKLMNKHLPDSMLAKKHKELLDKTHEGEIDVQAVTKGLDMAYKLKGKYAPEKKELSGSVETTASPQAIALAKEYEEKLKKGL